jgi:hypothetical protein
MRMRDSPDGCSRLWLLLAVGGQSSILWPGLFRLGLHITLLNFNPLQVVAITGLDVLGTTTSWTIAIGCRVDYQGAKRAK